MSARSRSRSTPRKSPSARPWCGTARSAPSRSSRSIPAPWRWRARWPSCTGAEQAPVGGGRRRHGGGAGRGRRRGEVLLRLDGRRRLPRMDGRQDPARRCGPHTGGVGLEAMSTPPPLPDRPRLPWDPPEHFEKRIPDGDNRERLVCGRCEFIHYQNPKIVAGAVCTWNDKILLRQAGDRAAQGILDPAGGLHGAGRDHRAGRRSARRARKPAPPSRSSACSPCTAWRASARCRSCIARGW